MSGPIVAVALVLIGYAALAASYLGWGSVAARALRITTSNVMLVWLGWAVVLLIFQMLHLVFPLNAFVDAPVFLLGMAFAIPHLRGLRVKPAPAIALAIAACWVASRSMLPPQAYDSGLYYLNTIRWIHSWPIVPGLGNLHGRLAFNQSYFTYAASLNLAPLFANGYRIANGFLFLLGCATLIARLRPSATHPFASLPSLFALPILGHLALLSPGLTSPTPDLASEILQLVMFVMLAGLLSTEEHSPGETGMLLILAATAITIKLSNLAFAVVVMAIVLAMARQLRVVVLVAGMLLVWMARGYVSSGAPLYPSTIGHMAFDWAVPRADVAQMAALIRGWARVPNHNWRVAVENGTWMNGWLQRIRDHHVEIVLPLILGICFFGAAFRKPRRESLLLIPVLAGLAFWFLIAPEPRFAHALFFCFAMAAALLFLASVQPRLSQRNFTLVLCAVFVVTHLGIALQAIHHRHTIAEISLTGWQPIRAVPLIRRTTASGLTVLTPTTGDRCWDAPLPCTPYFRDDLRLRVPGRLESGFAVSPVE